MLPVLAILAYALTRSMALAQIGDDVGNWTEPLGIVALTAEALLTCSPSGTAACGGHPSTARLPPWPRQDSCPSSACSPPATPPASTEPPNPCSDDGGEHVHGSRAPETGTAEHGAGRPHIRMAARIAADPVARSVARYLQQMRAFGYPVESAPNAGQGSPSRSN
jgi:hypothetical protein